MDLGRKFFYGAIRIMNAWNEWKKNLGEARPWHLLDPNRKIKDQQVVEKRMKICDQCPHLIKLTKQCTLCGCFMPAKTTLSNAECPIHKWGKEDE